MSRLSAEERAKQILRAATEVFAQSNYRNLAGTPIEKIRQLSETLVTLLQKPFFGAPDDEAIKAAEAWEKFCQDFFRAYQEQALAEV